MLRCLSSPTVALLAVGALAIVVSGCHRADAILLIEVAGDLRLAPVQLKATVSAGTATRTLTVPAAPRPITLPASFSVELDQGFTGPVTVNIDAYDAADALLGSGLTTQDHINVGEDTIITVTIVPVVPFPDDAGVTTDAQTTDARGQ